MQRRIVVIGLVLVTGMILSACAPNVAPPETPAAIPVSGPLAGATMAWVDGSTLVYIPMPQARSDSACNTSGLCDARLDIAPPQVAPQTGAGGGIWLTLNPVSNYQFSLCVQAGNCKAPSNSDYRDPSRETAPVSIIGPEIVGPDHSGGYCAWIGGRVPTDAELTAMGDASVHTALGGADLIGNLHCVIDAPRPRPMYFRTSPYYDSSTSMAEMLAQPAGSQTFCQNGNGFQTLDLALPPDHSIQSVNGDGHTQCSQLEGGRILCGGDGGTNPQLTVGLVCDSRGSIACQPGSDFQAAGCSNNMHAGSIAGMDDWEMDSNGALVPLNGQQLPDGAIGGPITHPLNLINGVMVAQSLTVNALSTNSLSTNSLSTNGLADNAVAGNGAPTNGAPGIGKLLPAVCPVGFFADSSAQQCTSLGASEPTCLDGFSFDEATKTCMSQSADGNYPGCPAGQLFDPSTDACDAHTQIVSATQLIHTQAFQLNLPDCSNPNREKDQPGSPGSDSIIICLKNCK